MDVIVIGGGVAGVSTAYQLRAAGHRVCVVEQHATVAQRATFGSSAQLSPSPLDVWFGPGMASLAWHTRFTSRAGILYRPGLNLPLWRWTRRLRSERGSERFRQQYGRLRPLIELAQATLGEIETRHGLEFEQRTGVLYLLRSARELKQAATALALLKEYETPHQELSAEQCVALEPSLPPQEPLAGGVLLPDGRSANCPLFVKQLKQLLEDGGVKFELGRAVASIRLEQARVTLELAPHAGQRPRPGAVETISADAVVVAAGAGSASLLARAHVRLPLHPVRLHAVTAPLAHEERAPHIAIVDVGKRISITRLNQRIKIAGAGVLQSRRRTTRAPDPALRDQALTLLGQAAHDWIPGAAKLAAGLDWDGVRLLSPDGLPVVGATAHARLFVNIAHGPAGWGLACGSATVVADLVSGRVPELPPDVLGAIAPRRFTG